MKTCQIIIVISSILIQHLCSHAQLKMGIHGGMNVSSINPAVVDSENNTGTGYGESKSRNGFYCGILGELKISRSNSLLLVIDYSQKEYNKYKLSVQPGFGFRRDENIGVNILELKAILLYGLPLGNGKVSIGAGGGSGYSISGRNKERYASSFTRDTLRYKDIVTKKFVPTVTGLLKYDFNFGIYLEIMFDYVFKAQPKTNLTVFSIGGGYILPFNKKRSK